MFFTMSCNLQGYLIVNVICIILEQINDYEGN